MAKATCAAFGSGQLHSAVKASDMAALFGRLPWAHNQQHPQQQRMIAILQPELHSG